MHPRVNRLTERESSILGRIGSNLWCEVNTLFEVTNCKLLLKIRKEKKGTNTHHKVNRLLRQQQRHTNNCVTLSCSSVLLSFILPASAKIPFEEIPGKEGDWLMKRKTRKVMIKTIDSVLLGRRWWLRFGTTTEEDGETPFLSLRITFLFLVIVLVIIVRKTLLSLRKQAVSPEDREEDKDDVVITVVSHKFLRRELNGLPSV